MLVDIMNNLISPYWVKTMARQKNQVIIFTDLELQLFQNTFIENEDLLYAVRSVLCQLPLNESDLANLTTNLSKDVISTIQKRILPVDLNDLPLGQLSDFYMTINQDLNQRRYDDTYPIIKSKELQINFLTQQFNVLFDIVENKRYNLELQVIQLHDLKSDDDEEKYIKVLARNYLLSHIDKMLLLIKHIAGNKKETSEEQKTRLMRDSSK